MDTLLGGARRLDQDVLWYATVTSVATFLPETFMAQVSKDERISKTLPLLWDGCMEDTRFVAQIRDSVWQRLTYVATAEDTQVQRLRSDCIQATLTSFAFLNQRVFLCAKAMPWALTLGDIAKNVDTLIENKEHQDDSIAIKILKLDSLGGGTPALYHLVSFLDHKANPDLDQSLALVTQSHTPPFHMSSSRRK